MASLRRCRKKDVRPESLVRRLVEESGMSKDEIVASIEENWSLKSSSSSSSQQRPCPPPSLRLGTVCSGTDAPVLAWEMLTKVLGNNGEASSSSFIEMDHVFSCENIPWKRKFIMKTTAPPLLFDDVTEIASCGRGTCDDETIQEMPDFDVLIAGPECVDFSRLNNAPKSLRAGGKSGKTFFATLDLVEMMEPVIVIMENVATCPTKEMMQAFEDIGYIGIVKKLTSSDYLLPQSRTRTYFVFLHKKKVRFLPSCDWESKIEQLECTCDNDNNEAESLSWIDFLRDDGKPEFKKKSGKSSNVEDAKNMKWLKNVKKFEKDFKLTPKHDKPGGRPYSDATQKVKALGHLPDRCKVRLDVLCKRALKVGIDPFVTPLVWNPGQQLQYTNVGYDENATPLTVAPCITPQHEWIVSNHRRPFTGIEALALQGIPIPPKRAIKQFSSENLRNLAGNAMSTTVVAAVLLTTFLTTELLVDNLDKTRRNKRKAVTSFSFSASRCVTDDNLQHSYQAQYDVSAARKRIRVGTCFEKKFGHMGYFEGKVVKLPEEDDATRPYYSVVYEDGDEEELELAELLPLLLEDDNETETSSAQSHSQQYCPPRSTISRRQRKPPVRFSEEHQGGIAYDDNSFDSGEEEIDDNDIDDFDI